MSKKTLLVALFLALALNACGQPEGASFGFDQDEITSKAGETFTVQMLLSSPKAIDAVDALVSFDPAMLSVEKASKGELFEIYPLKSTDNKKGLVKISAASREQFFQGEDGVYATLTFKSLKAGETELAYQYESKQASHSDTDVMSEGTDLMSAAETLEVTIQ